MMRKHKRILTTASIATVAACSLCPAIETVYNLDPLYVTGDLLNSPAERLPSSFSILDGPDLNSSGSQHFEDVTGFIPNLNWAGGTSRARYFQIRGIGENSQFGNEIPASSVGFMIDGIDFTGIATVAGLYDIAKIEILRGPQAAAFGANAMAGMVLVETFPATGQPGSEISGTVGSHNLLSFGLADGGVIAGTGLNYRVSVNHYRDDGFRHNAYLERDDTNKRDEWSTHLKLNWHPYQRFTVDLNLMYFDFDNGYDAWALDNDSFNTTTDEPGQDLQQTAAAGLRVTWHMTDTIDILYAVSVTDSELLYSYDWDWSNPAELMQRYGDEVYWGTDITGRTRDVWSHDLRLTSAGKRAQSGPSVDWAAGFYHKDFQEQQSYFGIESDYGTTTTALYGQSRLTLTSHLAITAAARIEEHEIDFTSLNPWLSEVPMLTELGGDERIWGGKMALEYTPDDTTLFYISVDRGYKAGGINLDDEVPLAYRQYDSENLINYELGWRRFYPASKFSLKANIFYMDRRDIQVDSSVQLGDGNTFALYKDNAASGINYGLELETRWQATTQVEFFANLGLLGTRFDAYSYIDPADGVTMIDLAGRDQAYAPGYTYAVGATYHAENGFLFGASVEGKDAYLFDVRNDQWLDACNLVRMHLGYTFSGWTGTLWIKNALDEAYDIRGFYFANEPPYYDTPKKWLSQGTPRQFGFTVRKLF